MSATGGTEVKLNQHSTYALNAAAAAIYQQGREDESNEVVAKLNDDALVKILGECYGLHPEKAEDLLSAVYNHIYS